MRLSSSVISTDPYFHLGICSLLSHELIDENFYIIDVDTTVINQVRKYANCGKPLIAFVSNDLDYYALKKINNILFIDKKRKLNEILSFLIANDKKYQYRIKFKLSSREREVMDYLYQGMSSSEISEVIGMKLKTFYTHRRNLIRKLRIGNRISLYRDIARRDLEDNHCVTPESG